MFVLSAFKNYKLQFVIAWFLPQFVLWFLVLNKCFLSYLVSVLQFSSLYSSCKLQSPETWIPDLQPSNIYFIYLFTTFCLFRMHTNLAISKGSERTFLTSYSSHFALLVALPLSNHWVVDCPFSLGLLFSLSTCTPWMSHPSGSFKYHPSAVDSPRLCLPLDLTPEVASMARVSTHISNSHLKLNTSKVSFWFSASPLFLSQLSPS